MEGVNFMRMKCLKLHGFKSFCKETDILFSDGTSAIVGPNGCGKSNVVDALRWVLGEQSPKRLRGKNMEEILFGGSEQFPPASMAKVSLVLAQKDRGFPHPYSEFEELSIERIYYRGGESEYRINRMPARLKDIIDLFSDTGTGTRAYSIIEQGYIGEIISAGPERRRLFIEEAAGIVKYKRRKSSALRKMEATEENLRHIEAIHFEIKRQMNALNRQAQKARRYQRLKEDIRRLDCTLAFRQHHALVDQERSEQAIKGEGEQKAARLVAEFSREEAEIEEIRADLIHENREMEEKKAKLLDAGSGIEPDREQTNIHKTEPPGTSGKAGRGRETDCGHPGATRGGGPGRDGTDDEDRRAFQSRQMGRGECRRGTRALPRPS